MNLRELVEKDLEYQERMAKSYKSELRGLPKGILYVKTNGGRHEYYRIDELTRKRVYIKKDQSRLVESLKKRKFFELTLKAIEGNVKVERAFLKNYRLYDYAAITQKIPLAYRFEIQNDVKVNSMKHYDDETLHDTTFGLKVRSKSEAIICELIRANNVDFEYEKEVSLFRSGSDRIIVHPDFTFENKVTGERFYWEHMGMLGNEAYRRKNIEKLLLYADNDIIMGANLFITADTISGKIDIRAITRTLEIIKALL